jgi:hypothetical protein
MSLKRDMHKPADEIIRGVAMPATYEPPELCLYPSHPHVSDQTNNPKILLIEGDHKNRSEQEPVGTQTARPKGRGREALTVLVDFYGEQRHPSFLALYERIELLTGRIACACNERHPSDARRA